MIGIDPSLDDARHVSTEAVPHVVIAVNQPIQHFSASFRAASQSARLRLSVNYWEDTAGGQFDPEFGRHVTWDADLLSGYHSVNAHGAGSASRALSFLRSMRSLVPDLVVCFGWASAAARLTIPWCLLTRTPFLFYGDTSWQHDSTGFRAWLRHRMLRVAFRLASGALSSGAFNREFYIRLGMHPARIFDSVYPIDVDSYAAARHTHPHRGQIMIGFAGKLIARKGVDELLRALAVLSDDSSWNARIIGEGEERESLVELSLALGISSRVEFRGFRNASEMPAELAECDIVVVPSTRDNRGMIAAEAMAAGAAVIVSSNTGVWGRGDLIQEGRTGRVYRSGDHAELASVLGQLLGDAGLRESLRREGALRAAEHGPDAFRTALELATATIRRRD